MDFDNCIKLQEGLNMVSNLEITPFTFLPSKLWCLFCVLSNNMHSYTFFLLIFYHRFWKLEKINVEPSLNIYKYWIYTFNNCYTFEV